MPTLSAPVELLDQGIHVIDTGFHRPRFDASYLVVEHGRAAFIDTGTNHAVSRLLGALDALGIARDAVDWVIPTHVHLDHAGGAGLLMQHLPSATLLIHPRGARHMINPSMLVASATRVYGEAEIARSYGRIVGVPAQRMQRTHDGMVVELAGRALQFLDTPGHARHHHCIWDVRTRGFFTGDTFGLSYREFDTEQGPWLLPTTTPIHFDPAALRASVQRLLGFDPQSMYLTHFGRVGDVRRLGTMLLEQLDDIVALGRRLRAAPVRHAALKQGLLDLYIARLRRHGCTFDRARIEDLLGMDIELNAQGMAIWLDREAS